MRIGPFSGWDSVFYFDGLLDILLLVVLLVLVLARNQLIVVELCLDHALLTGLVLLVVAKCVDALVAVIAGLTHHVVNQLTTVDPIGEALSRVRLIDLEVIACGIATSAPGLLDRMEAREGMVAVAVFVVLHERFQFALFVLLSHRAYGHLPESVVSIELALLILHVGLFRVHLVLKNNYNRI